LGSQNETCLDSHRCISFGAVLFLERELRSKDRDRLEELDVQPMVEPKSRRDLGDRSQQEEAPHLRVFPQGVGEGHCVTVLEVGAFTQRIQASTARASAMSLFAGSNPVNISMR
jgi:hypothetical protein